MAITSTTIASFRERYLMIPVERYEALMNRIEQFTATLNDPSTEPVKVFEPLAPALVDQIFMIRAMSQELQTKKDEDMRRQAAQAEEAHKDNDQEEEESKVQTETETEVEQEKTEQEQKQ